MGVGYGDIRVKNPTLNTTLWFLDSINGIPLPVPIEVKPNEEHCFALTIYGWREVERTVIEGTEDGQ